MNFLSRPSKKSLMSALIRVKTHGIFLLPEGVCRVLWQYCASFAPRHAPTKKTPGSPDVLVIFSYAAASRYDWERKPSLKIFSKYSSVIGSLYVDASMSITITWLFFTAGIFFHVSEVRNGFSPPLRWLSTM